MSLKVCGKCYGEVVVRLRDDADGAALVGAEAWQLETVRLTASDLDNVELVRAAADEGRTGTVTLRSVWHAPLRTELIPLTVTIEVTVTARSVFR